MCMNHTAQRLVEGRLTIFGTCFNHHVAHGHAFLHAHGRDGITSELHGLVGAACVPNVHSQHATFVSQCRIDVLLLGASVVKLLGGLLIKQCRAKGMKARLTMQMRTC